MMSSSARFGPSPTHPTSNRWRQPSRWSESRERPIANVALIATVLLITSNVVHAAEELSQAGSPTSSTHSLETSLETRIAPAVAEEAQGAGSTTGGEEAPDFDGIGEADGIVDNELGDSPSKLPLTTEWGEEPPEWALQPSRYEDRLIVGVGRGPSLRVAAAVALAGAARAREARIAADAQAATPVPEDVSSAGERGEDAGGKAGKRESDVKPGEEVGREPGAVARVTQASWELGRIDIHARVMRSRHKDPPSREVVETTGLKLDEGDRSFVLFVTRTERHREEEVRQTVSIESTTSGYSFQDFLAALKDSGVNLRVFQTATEFFVEASYEQK